MIGGHSEQYQKLSVGEVHQTTEVGGTKSGLAVGGADDCGNHSGSSGIGQALEALGDGIDYHIVGHDEQRKASHTQNHTDLQPAPLNQLRNCRWEGLSHSFLQCEVGDHDWDKTGDGNGRSKG